MMTTSATIPIPMTRYFIFCFEFDVMPNQLVQRTAGVRVFWIRSQRPAVFWRGAQVFFSIIIRTPGSVHDGGSLRPYSQLR